MLLGPAREGAVAGQHEVNFPHGDERLRLVHDITDRDVFARGALALAKILVDQPPGQYTLGALWGEHPRE
jgi:4-hydroxy-tetrahydrodipicolinate reductase